MFSIFRRVPDLFRFWCVLAVAIIFLCFLIYASVQQNLRHSADDPQIQIAEDWAGAFGKGVNPKVLENGQKSDVSKTLAPFVMVFDNSDELVSSTAQIDGKSPVPPSGVFGFTKTHGEDRFTWQPQKGVRLATVVVYYKQGQNEGYVLAGRSLRETERREDQLFGEVVIGAIMILAVSFFATLILSHKSKKS